MTAIPTSASLMHRSPAAFFQSIGRLIEYYPDTAQDCDVIFYDETEHCGLVTGFDEGGSFSVYEVNKQDGCVLTTNKRIMMRGLKPTHIGRILN